MDEVKGMNMSAVGIGLGIPNHPHVVMKNMTQDVANEFEIEVGDAVVMTNIDVRRAKGTLQCILSMTSHLPTL